MGYMAHILVLVSISVPQKKKTIFWPRVVWGICDQNLCLKGQMMPNIQHASFADIQTVPHIGSE